METKCHVHTVETIKVLLETEFIKNNLESISSVNNTPNVNATASSADLEMSVDAPTVNENNVAVTFAQHNKNKKSPDWITIRLKKQRREDAYA